MPVTALDPDSTTFLKISTHALRPRLRYEIDASDPVYVYVVDDEGRGNYEDEEDEFESWNRRTYGRHFAEEVRLPDGGDWYIAIYNPGKEVVAINYEIEF